MSASASLAAKLGAVLVAQFAWSLLSRAGAALLDMNPSPELTAEIRARLTAEGERVVDLHLWRLGPGHHAAVAVVASDAPLPPEAPVTRVRRRRESRGRARAAGAARRITFQHRRVARVGELALGGVSALGK